MKISTRERQEYGFTLSELLVVILIIGILAAIAIPMFLNQRTSAQEAALKSDLKNAATQIEGAWNTKTNQYKKPIFVNTSEKNPDEENGAPQDSNEVGPIFTSDESNVSFQSSGENFCLVGNLKNNPGITWYFSSASGKLSREAMDCASTPLDPDEVSTICAPDVLAYMKDEAAAYKTEDVNYRAAYYKTNKVNNTSTWNQWYASPEYLAYDEAWNLTSDYTFWNEETPEDIEKTNQYYQGWDRADELGYVDLWNSLSNEYSRQTSAWNTTSRQNFTSTHNLRSDKREYVQAVYDKYAKATDLMYDAMCNPNAPQVNPDADDWTLPVYPATQFCYAAEEKLLAQVEHAYYGQTLNGLEYSLNLRRYTWGEGGVNYKTWFINEYTQQVSADYYEHKAMWDSYPAETNMRINQARDDRLIVDTSRTLAHQEAGLEIQRAETVWKNYLKDHTNFTNMQVLPGGQPWWDYDGTIEYADPAEAQAEYDKYIATYDNYLKLVQDTPTCAS